MTTEATPPTPAEQLAETEAKRDQIESRLEAARAEFANLRADHTKERESYLAAGVGAELEGSERPSRARLTELERQLPDAEDRVEVLTRALQEAERPVRIAKARVLREQAAALRADAAERQAHVHGLQAEINERQRQIDDHHHAINNRGPVQAHTLDHEALQLERGA